ncbi:senescence-associated protein OSA15, chloroplastic [Typha latifolia]|uniref:senescence-associated protein OSA15, chloroplastic n=1 Tax=Typha latifolia TaxID=4733 RepID=UPI003C2F2B06
MPYMATRVAGGAVAIERSRYIERRSFSCSMKSLCYIGSTCTCQKFDLRKSNHGHLFTADGSFWLVSGKSYSCMFSRSHVVSCHSAGTHSSEAKKCTRSSEVCTDAYSDQLEEELYGESGSQLNGHQSTSGSKSIYSSQGLAEACKFVYNDAKFVNERAQNDILLLSRGITRLNDRARQDVAVLGLGFLKLDARARKDTQKIDRGVKKKAAHLNYIATILKDKAQSDLKRVADQHWSDGALEADLRRADVVVRRRAMEDAFMALKFVKDIHDMMANKLYQQPPKEGSISISNTMGFITLEKNGRAVDLFARELSTDRVTAIEDAYWSMASALSEADGIDYTDPEELELLVATLIDLDAMDGKTSVSLLAECSSSPDVNTRKALANALAVAPSMWILGNAGMGALQRLAQDSNPAVSAAASKAINELKKQWELEEGDSLRFMMNQLSEGKKRDDADSDASDLS